MQVLRTIEAEAGNPPLFCVGDVLAFELMDGEKVEAMAMKETDQGMIFCFVDCLKDEENMHDLPGKLNTTILERFPKEIRDVMGKFPDGRFLRLPTEKETFGCNEIGADEGDDVQQWEPMKDRRNRIAFQGLHGDSEWWWTETPDKDDAAHFAFASNSGYCSYNHASGSYGVRPAFLISNPRPLVGRGEDELHDEKEKGEKKDAATVPDKKSALRFVLMGKVYDVAKMEFIGNVKKRIPVTDPLTLYIYGPDATRLLSGKLYRSQKGNWLLVVENRDSYTGIAIDEDEARRLLMKWDLTAYEKAFGPLEEA